MPRPAPVIKTLFPFTVFKNQSSTFVVKAPVGTLPPRFIRTKMRYVPGLGNPYGQDTATDTPPAPPSSDTLPVIPAHPDSNSLSRPSLKPIPGDGRRRDRELTSRQNARPLPVT